MLHLRQHCLPKPCGLSAQSSVALVRSRAFNLETKARELGVLAEWEAVANE